MNSIINIDKPYPETEEEARKLENELYKYYKLFKEQRDNRKKIHFILPDIPSYKMRDFGIKLIGSGHVSVDKEIFDRQTQEMVAYAYKYYKKPQPSFLEILAHLLE
jgi:hypothetical protein